MKLLSTAFALVMTVLSCGGCAKREAAPATAKTGRSAKEIIAAATQRRAQYSAKSTKARLRGDDRKSCEEYYPPPPGNENWTNCREIEHSECGGPGQCACENFERLITYTCDQGTFSHCAWQEDCEKTK